MGDNLGVFSTVSRESILKKKKWSVIYDNYIWQTIGVGMGSFIID